MPIDRKILDQLKTKQSQILKFLCNNKEQAFSELEILNGIDFSKFDITLLQDLNYLKLCGYVDGETINDIPYYAISEKGIEFLQTSK
jgi:hypothetical protein